MRCTYYLSVFECVSVSRIPQAICSIVTRSQCGVHDCLSDTIAFAVSCRCAVRSDSVVNNMLQFSGEGTQTESQKTSRSWHLYCVRQ